MLDITLLRIMKYRQDYLRLSKAVPMNTMDDTTKLLLSDFGKYFQQFPEHEAIDVQVFLPSFKRWHPLLGAEQMASHVAILKAVQKDVDECTRDGILSELFELDLGTRVANLCNKYDEGDLEAPLAVEISRAIDEFKLKMGANVATWIDDDIADLLKADANEEGLQWRLKCLRDSMRPLRYGDFGLVAGRPDKGKTTFLVSEITHMAPQLPEDKNIIWFNNEGPGSRILPRIYQAALGKTLSEIIELSNSGKLVGEYERVIGRRDKIRVIDIHGWHVGQVEAVLENMEPGLVVYDMIDNIRGFGGAARTDLQLEEMYKWARELSVKHNVIGLATSQISAEGDGLMFPGLSMLKDSKTGKQGAVDFQIMIGASNDQGLSGSRFIGIPKNKLRREMAPGDPQQEVRFNPMIARYEDTQNGD